jgi:hypothetical protein
MLLLSAVRVVGVMGCRAAHNLVQAKAGGDDFTVRVACFTVVGNGLGATAGGTSLPTWTAYAN